jgi:quinol monooxygenase YgiN
MLRVLALAALAMTVSGASAALAQNANFYTVTYIEVGPILAKLGVAALRPYRDAGRRDEGNVRLEVLQRVERPNQFAVLGAWTNQKAFDAHAAAVHTKTMYEKIDSIAAAPSDTRRHSALSIAPSKSARDAVFALSHVDVIPPQKDNGVVALKQLAGESRAQSRNLQFDVWQQVDRPNHFTVVEVWSSRGGFNVHTMQKPTKEFRAKLAPMSGALYDERLYKALR